MPSDVASNSQLRTFKRCRRKYWLAFVRRLHPIRFPFTGPRQLGTRVHGALQAYYDVTTDWAHGRDRAIAYLESLRDQELAKVEEGGDLGAILKEHDLAVAMVEGYAAWAVEEGVDVGLTPVAAEQLVRTPSPVPGVDLMGKLDLVVRKESDGAEGFIDYKTVGDLQSPLKHLGMDEQFRMYALMQRLIAASLGQSPVRFHIYRMLKKSKRTARAKPPFFADYEVYISDPELRAMWDRLFGELTDLLDFERRIEAHPERHRSIAYPTPTRDCSWECDFYMVCPMFDDDRADPEHVLVMNYEEGDPHAHYGDQLTSDPEPVE